MRSKAVLHTGDDSTVFQFYAKNVLDGLSPGSLASVDSTLINLRWAQQDLALLALILGVTRPIVLQVEAIEWSRPNRTGNLRVSVKCTSAGIETSLGTYSLPFIKNGQFVIFRTKVVDLWRAANPRTVDMLNLVTRNYADVDTNSVRKDIQFLHAAAEQLHIRIPSRLDVVVTSPSDSSLSILGVSEFAAPISQIAFGNFIVSRARSSGGIDRHELIHAIEPVGSMHPYVAEGIAVFLAGSRGSSLFRGACEHRNAIDSQTEMTLRKFVVGESGGLVDEGAKTFVLGFLGAILANQPHNLWALSEETIGRKQFAEIFQAWNELIHATLRDCNQQ